MSMAPYENGIKSLQDTPFGYTLSMLGGKWRLVILYWLVEYDCIRFNELHRKIGTITFKTLSTQLKEMERDGLIIRREYPQIPPKVEYRLSEKGRSLLSIMEAMCEWGMMHKVNSETLQAMDDAVEGRNLTGSFNSAKEALKYLDD